mmetsp:Transcript_78148/g.168964  ORF Transcript_78148/g.168964 Transcript_78148/m.168964 type:complete len:208 (-) Transcript_78148:46-669(-)
MSIAAASAARRRNERLVRRKQEEMGGDRKSLGVEMDRKGKAIHMVMKKYDTNKSGKLEKDQVRKLLTDLDDSTPPGTEPTDEEFDFIMKIADCTVADDAIDHTELERTIKAWHAYTSKREEMDKLIDQYDKSGSGTLTRDELKTYLTDLNGGKEVAEEEVEWVMKEADVLGDGQIHRMELVMATATWYSNGHQELEDQKKSKVCCIL